MNQANVTMNKAKKITYGMTNGEIDLSEGYIAKLQERAAKKLEGFMKEMRGAIVEHDHNKVKYNDDYIFKNAECNRHLISDLQKVIDNLNHKWAKKLIEILTKMNKKREWLIKKGKEEFEQEELNNFEDKFEKVMLEAIKENDKEEQKYYIDKEKTLILRILDYKAEYLLWVYNFDVPFTNNLSERGLRGVKSKQKVSGQFWEIESAEWYATIRTYIETCQRNKVNVYNALLKLVLGKPYTLKEILKGVSD